MIDINRLLAANPRRFGAGLALAACAALAVPSAHAGPGAHGPGGEHLDQPAGAAFPSSRPRVEARSDLFELVASLQEGELSVLVDRFETNEPVLRAELEVEGAGRKAMAKFREDRGDYVVADPAFIKAIASPGEHALVFTLKAGNDADLLDGTLAVLAHDQDGAPSPGGLRRSLDSYLVPVAAAIAVIGVIAGLMWYRRRRPGVVELPQGRR